ncbi:hypothetical protein KAH81_02940 [bacterium]|nr:hypothetical protein [bacterium]
MGLMYYLSVDYDQWSSFPYQWQAGWALHSLPFRADLAYNPRLIDIFPDALQAMYWDQENNTYQTINTGATLSGSIGDIIRYNSIFVLHSSSGSSSPYGWAIHEQRFLDIRPEDQLTLYRQIGTVVCQVPFDCSSPTCEPDDNPDCAIEEAWRWDQSSSNWVVIDDIETFGLGNYGGDT